MGQESNGSLRKPSMPETSAWDAICTAIDDEVRHGLPQLFDSIRIASVSAKEDGEMGRSADYLRSVLENDGWSVDVHQIATNVCLSAEIAPAAVSGVAPILLYGHHDVQPAEPLDAWDSPPFEPALRDGRIYGRGAADDKGQFFAHLFALRAVRRVVGEVPVHLRLFLDGEEESGSPNLERVIDELGDRLRSELMYTADGAAELTGQPRITFGFRGDLQLELRVRTLRGNQHSGHWGNLAPDAAMAIANVIASLKNRDDRVAVRGFYDDVRAPTAAERATIEAMPFDEGEARQQLGSTRLAGPSDVSPMERRGFLPALSVVGLSSGYSGPGFQASIPAEAIAKIDVRFVPDQDPDRLFLLLRDHIKAVEPAADLELLRVTMPSRTPMDTPAAEKVIRAIRRGFDAEPVIVPAAGGSSPDWLFTERLGVHSIWGRFGNPDLNNHAPNENFKLDNLVKAARCSAALFLEFADPGTRLGDS